MKTHAVLVAVGDYKDLAPKLTAPLQELDGWRYVLNDIYHFQRVDELPDDHATRPNVLKALRELFTGAGAGDQLLFVFMGHGGRSTGWISDTDLGNTKEHALFVSPAGENNIRQATITPSDIVRLLDECEPHVDADITFVLDACFAEDFDFEPPPEIYDAKPLFVPHWLIPGIERGPVTATFEALVRTIRGERALPLLVLASSKGQAAHEITEHGERRLLFTMRLVRRLRQVLDKTYEKLLDAIKPLKKDFPQTPTFGGNTDRIDEPFPGDRAKLARAELRRPSLQVDPPWVDLRFVGMGTFVQQPDLKKPYRARIVLPYDDYGHGPAKHIGFVEIAAQDIKDRAGQEPTRSYVRGGIPYLRWELTNHRVSIGNADPNQSFTRTDAFRQHVPDMPRVCPELATKLPRPECLADAVDPNQKIIVGLIDIRSGQADIGPLEEFNTLFTRQYGDDPTKWGPERTPMSVVVRLPVTDSYAVIIISDSQGNGSQIAVHGGRTIVAGNAREADINGPGSGESPREHYLIYYNLCRPEDRPFNPALPKVDLVPMNACSSNTWP